MATKRKSGDERRKHILDCAAKLVGKFGAKNVTRRMVAKEAKLSDALIAHYFGPIADAQKKFRAHAKKLNIMEPTKEQIETIGEKLRKKPRKVAAVKKATKLAGEKGSVLKARSAAKVAKKATAAKVAKKATAAKKSGARAAATPATAGRTRSAATTVSRPRGSSQGSRKRSVAEVKAIKDKAAGVRPKTAARAPKAPPALPPLPVPPVLPPLPTLADAA